MFGLGFWEITVIVLIVIVFIKPDDLPKFVYKIGKFYGNLMSYFRQIKNQIDASARKVEYEIQQAEAKMSISSKEPKKTKPRVTKPKNVKSRQAKKNVVKKTNKKVKNKVKLSHKSRKKT